MSLIEREMFLGSSERARKRANVQKNHQKRTVSALHDTTQAESALRFQVIDDFQ